MKNLYNDREQPISTKWTSTSHLNSLKLQKKPRYMTLEIQIKMSELFNSNEKFGN